MKVTLLAHTVLADGFFTVTNGEIGRWAGEDQLIEYAGRLCYNSTDKLGHNLDFIRARIREGHEDIIEHASATFLVEGISRSCLAQWTRHRLLSYSVLSQRYVDQTSSDTVMPPINDELLRDEVATAYAQAFKAYSLLRAAGVRKEDARFVLPEATCTTMVVSGNLRSWRHFLKLRLASAAQWEIRAAACRILDELWVLAPNVFEDIYQEHNK